MGTIQTNTTQAVMKIPHKYWTFKITALVQNACLTEADSVVFIVLGFVLKR